MQLPLVDENRQAFGFSRTVCACKECTINCKYIPGFLTPQDLEALAPIDNGIEAVLAWAEEHLLASPGATAVANGKVFEIPTLVPARAENGACHWLDNNDRCQVHKSSPYGCSFVDAHMSFAESQKRSNAGIFAVYRAWEDQGLYAKVWAHLTLIGKKSPSPAVSRQKMTDDILKLSSQTTGRNDLCPCGSGKKFKRCCLSLCVRGMK